MPLGEPVPQSPRQAHSPEPENSGKAQSTLPPEENKAYGTVTWVLAVGVLGTVPLKRKWPTF